MTHVCFFFALIWPALSIATHVCCLYYLFVPVLHVAPCVWLLLPSTFLIMTRVCLFSVVLSSCFVPILDGNIKMQTLFFSRRQRRSVSRPGELVHPPHSLWVHHHRPGHHGRPRVGRDGERSVGEPEKIHKSSKTVLFRDGRTGKRIYRPDRMTNPRADSMYFQRHIFLTCRTTDLVTDRMTNQIMCQVIDRIIDRPADRVTERKRPTSRSNDQPDCLQSGRPDYRPNYLPIYQSNFRSNY